MFFLSRGRMEISRSIICRKRQKNLARPKEYWRSSRSMETSRSATKAGNATFVIFLQLRRRGILVAEDRYRRTPPPSEPVFSFRCEASRRIPARAQAKGGKQRGKGRHG